MSHSLNIGNLGRRLTQQSAKFLVLGQVLVGATLGLACFSSSAIAADSVTLQYGSSKVSTSILDVEKFAKTGTLTSPLQAFFQQVNQSPTQWRTLLTEKITIPYFIEHFIETPSGRHVLHRFDQMIYTSQGQELKDLDAAVAKALANDRTISILEVVQKFPEPNMNLNLTAIERDYQEIKQLVGDIKQENWNAAAQDVLKDAFCSCDTAKVGDVSYASPTRQVAPRNLALYATSSNCYRAVTQR